MAKIMRHALLSFVVLALAVLAAQPADAGISLGSGAMTLQAGQSGEMCDVWIYASQEGGTYHVETTGDLKGITTTISPNDFTLGPIDCPQENNARRACISETCLSKDESSCRIVCVGFTAPLLMSWSPEKVIYTGSILNSIRIGAATIKEPYIFAVHVEQLDMKPLVFGAVILAIIIVAVVLILVRKKTKKKK